MIPSLVLLLSILIPLGFAVLSILGYRRWVGRDKRRSPLSGKLHHSAGEQLRARMRDHSDDMMGGWMLMLMSSPLFMLAWALQFVPWRHVEFGIREAICIIGAVVLFALGLRSFLHHAGLRRQAAEGLAAERMTAQELNRLIGSGCQVLNDVPGEGFNLDHVVVGPRGVVMIETKSRKKPPRGKDDSHYKVQYDGRGLWFAGARRPTAEPITQARNQAQWLARYLCKATGRDVPVVPAVALPGWWVDSPKGSAQPDVRVFSPKGRGAQFMVDPSFGAPLDESIRALITQALVMRYPDAA